SSKDRPQVHPKRPGRKPGRGPCTFRAAPELDSATGPTVDIRHSEPSCPCSRRSLDLDGIEAASTTEIPPRPRPLVRIYRVHVYRGRSCGRRVRATHPELAADQDGATAHRLGPRVMATAHVLHYGLGIPACKVPQVLRVLTGVGLTQSAITQDALRRAARGVGQEYEELRDQIARADVVHIDDPGRRIGGVPASLMTFATDTATVYQVRDCHRNEEVREVIPADYPGVMVTDRGTSYDAEELAGVKQQKRLAHVSRSIDEVPGVRAGKACWFGRRSKELLRAALELWHGFRDVEMSGAAARRSPFAASWAVAGGWGRFRSPLSGKCWSGCRPIRRTDSRSFCPISGSRPIRTLAARSRPGRAFSLAGSGIPPGRALLSGTL